MDTPSEVIAAWSGSYEHEAGEKQNLKITAISDSRAFMPIMRRFWEADSQGGWGLIAVFVIDLIVFAILMGIRGSFNFFVVCMGFPPFIYSAIVWCSYAAFIEKKPYGGIASMVDNARCIDGSRDIALERVCREILPKELQATTSAEFYLTNECATDILRFYTKRRRVAGIMNIMASLAMLTAIVGIWVYGFNTRSDVYEELGHYEFAATMTVLLIGGHFFIAVGIYLKKCGSRAKLLEDFRCKDCGCLFPCKRIKTIDITDGTRTEAAQYKTEDETVGHLHVDGQSVPVSRSVTRMVEPEKHFHTYSYTYEERCGNCGQTRTKTYSGEYQV